MILFSASKINIGLRIIARRGDGYHDLESYMVPLPFYDILEMKRQLGHETDLSLTLSGIPVPGQLEDNLCLRAAALFSDQFRTGPVRMHLHKQVPAGAGLGGGSSNATTVLKGMNLLAGNIAGEDKLHEMASLLGSDCPFFLHDTPMLARGRGEVLTATDLDLSGYYLALVCPDIAISTAEAYRAVQPDNSRKPLDVLLREPIETWRETVTNDFEKNLFRKHPLLVRIKTALYESGAIYAAMSGSGSALFGIFERETNIEQISGVPVAWQGKLQFPSGSISKIT